MSNACERNDWDYSTFEGPFLLTPDDGEQAYIDDRSQALEKGVDYRVWLVEFGNTQKGHLRGLADNEGKFQLLVDGYYN